MSEQAKQNPPCAKRGEGDREAVEGMPGLPAAGAIDLREKLMLVREARIIGGREAGRRAWHLVELPDVFSPAEEEPYADPVKLWLAERTIFEPGHREGATKLYQDYLSWCIDNDVFAGTMTAFGRRIGRHFDKIQSHGIYYLGLRLLAVGEVKP